MNKAKMITEIRPDIASVRKPARYPQCCVTTPAMAVLMEAPTPIAAPMTPIEIMKKDDWALFVGQWAAPFLIMGNYNKLVKQHGSDATDRLAA